jgi:hypothetical protein
MSNQPETEAQRRSRLRWITLGEAVAIAALVLSALGLWHEWNKRDDQPAKVIEERRPVALTLRGKSENDGRGLVIEPVESSHALQSVTIRVPGGTKPIEIGSDGELRASDVEDTLGKSLERGEGTHRIAAHVETRYVEAGADRRARGSYVLTYRWQEGGLFGGGSLRLVGIARG